LNVTRTQASFSILSFLQKLQLSLFSFSVGFGGINKLNRELALELRSYKNRNQILDKTCALWFLYLCKLQTLPHLGRLWLSIERTFNKKNKLKKEEKDKYLNGLFIPPKLSPF
jgi:hypothetical protein